MKFQKGRSMIEMLGVLAIIGVLSIGGIALYRRAINNHHANTILDDVNRFAFVITEKGNYPLDSIIPKGDFKESGIYELEGYQDLGSQQFSITVQNVPYGVCDALLEKAAVQYKVRVNEHGSGEKGLIYDEKYQDLCQSTNDVILYFGDTTDLCNPAQAGKGETNCGGCRCDGYCVTDSVTAEKVCCAAGQKAAGGTCTTGTAGQPCTSNAGCQGGEFCLLSGGLGSDGTCTNIGTVQKVTLSNGQTWARPDDGMYWDNAQNWCEALGFKPALLADLGCNNLVLGTTCDTTITTELQNEWKTGQYSHFWIDRHEYPGGAYTLNLYLKRVSSDGKNAHQMYPLCFTP